MRAPGARGASGVCDGCGSSLAPIEAAPDPAQRCAALRLQLRCGACDRWAPVDGVSLDEARCAACGMTSPLSDDDWRAVLGAAHAVADLVGPDPEGFAPSPAAIDRLNPFAEVGLARAAVQLAPEQVEGLTGWLPGHLRAWVAPGLPLSGEGRPLRLRAEGEGALEADDGAGERRRFGVDARAQALHPALLGAVADEHEVGRPEPDVVEAGGRLVCGSCRAPVGADGSEPRVRCGSCGAVSRVPAAIRHQAQGDPRPDTWWLVFSGPSPYRARLEGQRVVGLPPFPAPIEPELDWAPPPLRELEIQDLALSWAARLGLPVLALAVAGVVLTVVGWVAG